MGCALSYRPNAISHWQIHFVVDSNEKHVLTFERWRVLSLCVWVFHCLLLLRPFKCYPNVWREFERKAHIKWRPEMKRETISPNADNAPHVSCWRWRWCCCWTSWVRIFMRILFYRDTSIALIHQICFSYIYYCSAVWVCVCVCMQLRVELHSAKSNCCDDSAKASTQNHRRHIYSVSSVIDLFLRFQCTRHSPNARTHAPTRVSCTSTMDHIHSVESSFTANRHWARASSVRRGNEATCVYLFADKLYNFIFFV